jgi:WD40 repeat protein
LVTLLATTPSSPVLADPIPIANVTRGEAVNFEKEVLPLLSRSCLACHGAGERQGELVLESPETMRKGGDSGPALIPGRSADSLMLKLAAHQDDPQMPPEDNDVNAPPLSSAELGLLRLWIDQGARGSGGVAALSPKAWQSMPSRIVPVYAVALTEDGQYVAASRSNQLFLYHVPTGRMVAKLTDGEIKAADGTPAGVAHRDLVQSLTFNRDGDLLASGSFREVKLWRRPSDVQQRKYDAAAVVNALTVSPDKRLLAASSGNQVQIWTVDDGKVVATLQGHTDAVTGVRFTANGKQVVSSSKDSTIRVWDTASGKLAGFIRVPTPLAAIELVATAAKTEAVPTPAELIVTGGEDRIVRTLSFPTSAPQQWPGVAGALKLTAIGRDQKSVATLTDAGKLQVFRLVTGQWKEVANGAVDVANVTALSLHLVAEAEKPVVGSVFISTNDGTIQIWSIADKKVVTTWRGEAAPGTALSAASDGKLLTSGHATGAATLWKLEVPASEPLEGPAGGATMAYARSPSGVLLALSATLNGKPTILVRNLDSGKVTHQLVGHAGLAKSLAFSADNLQLVSGGDDQAVSIWNLRAGNAAPTAKIEGLGGVVDAVAFTRDAAQVLAATGNTIRTWKVADSEMVAEMAGHTGPIRYIGFGQDAVPYSVSEDNTVRFWNLVDGKQTRTFNMPAKLTAVAPTFDGQRLAIAGEDRQVRVFQLNNGQVLQTLPDSGTPVVSLAYNADAKRIVATLSDGQMKREAIVWDVAVTPPRRLESLIEPDLGVVLLDRKPGALVVGSTTGTWRRAPLRLTQRFEGFTKPIRRSLFAIGNRVVILAAEDGALRGFNVSDGKVTFSTSHGAVINDLTVSADGQIYATAGANNSVRLWRTNGAASNPSQITGLPGPATSVAFTHDGKKVIIGSGGNAPMIGVYDLATAIIQQQFPNHSAISIGVVGVPKDDTPEDDTERLGVVSFAPDSIWNWEVNAIRNITGHSGAITSLAALPTAPRQVVSGSLDSTARHWNLDTGQALRTFSHGGPVLAVAVRPDGQRVATASDNKLARLWNINGQQVAQLKGDLRKQTQVVRITQKDRASTARVTVAKQRLDAAEKDTPKKAEAEKKGAETLTKANADVIAKQDALAKVDKTKIDAEKLAIEASAKARQAQLAQTAAEDNGRLATEDVSQLQQRASQLNSLASASPENAELKQAAADAQAAVVAAQGQQQAIQKTVPDLTKVAQTAITAANQATQKATQQQKPYNDALAALNTSKSAQNLAAQQHVIAARELKTAQEAEPVAKQKHVRMEAALVEVKKELEAAKVAATASEMPLRALAFSPDNSILATAGDFGSAHTWDAETGAPLAAYAGHEQPLSATTFLDEQRLLTGSIDKSIRAWELNPEWRLEKTIGGVDRPDVISHRVLALDFSLDASQLLVGGGVPSRNGELSVFNVGDGKRTFYLPQAHDDVIHAAEFSPDGKRLASAAADKYVRTFDLASSQQLRRFEGHTNYVLGIAWKGDGQTLASAAADNTVKIWDAETGDQRRTITNFNKHVTSIHFVGETDTIVSSCGDRSVRMHNSVNGGNVRSFGGSDTWVHCVAIVPNSTVVAAGTAGGTLQVWNGTNGQVIKRLQVGVENEE